MSESTTIAAIATRFPEAVLSSHSYRGDDTVVLGKDALLEVAKFLKEESALRFDLLVDLAGVDYLTFGEGPAPAFFASSGIAVRPTPQLQDDEQWPGPPSARFAVVYHFYSMTKKHRVRLNVPVEEDDPTVDSLVTLWPGANWLEREVWDMYGIRFRGHPDLKRILMYKEFEGHPLRKDYRVNKRQPLIGPVN